MNIWRTCLLAAWLPVIGASAATLNLETTIDRPLRYRPEGTDFVIDNGPERFNRPLYTNTAFRVDGGDEPEFSLFLPGRGGVLRFGVRTPLGTRWLDQAASVEARYRPGELLYAISDPAFPGERIRLEALVLPAGQGLVVRAALEGAGAPLEFVWAYGGANGDRGRRDGDIGTESMPVSRFFALQPEHCRADTFAIGPTGFILRSPTAFVRGAATAGANYAQGDARLWDNLPALLASAPRTPPGKIPPAPPSLPVVVGRLPLSPGREPAFVALQRLARPGERIEELSIYRAVRASPDAPEAAAPPTAALLSGADLPAVFAAAQARRRAIADKVTVDTPDPFVNAAAAALCVAADAVWDEPSGTVQHGAVAWRARLLGWRGPYANDELGWHDRANRDFLYWAGRQNTSPIPERLPPADASANLSRNEAALHSNGDISDSHYDMNLVYIDQVFRHILWTGDLAFGRKLWPVIERHLAWERRLFRRPFGPEGLPLYEGYCCIWASDDVEYEGGGAAHSTAYNYYENRMAARLARLIGADPSPYDREADLIWRALHEELWLGDRGWLGEWKDLLGLQTVHESPAVWTFYHAVDSGAVTPLEAWQMSRFIDTRIASIPLRGPGIPADGSYVVPTTNWMPYTWSTNNVVMAEVTHTALGYWQSGRPEEAFRLFKGALLTSMFVGLCPGNAGMTTTFDMARGESQRDFADGVGATSRALVEGLFGVAADVPAGVLRVQPGFPAHWDRASIRHPDFTVAFRREGTTDRYAVESRFTRPLALRLIVPARLDGIARATVNGEPADLRPLDDAIGAPRVEIDVPAAPSYSVELDWSGSAPAHAASAAVAALGRRFSARWPGATLLKVADPQGALQGIEVDRDGFTAVASGRLGERTVFAQISQGRFRWWSPVAFDLRPPAEILADPGQDASHLRFHFRDNTFGSGAGAVVLPGAGSLPGTNRVAFTASSGVPAAGDVINWHLPAPPGTRFETLDLSGVLDSKVTDIFRRSYLAPRSPYCSLAIPSQGIGTWCRFQADAVIDDTGLRAVAGRHRGILATPQGVPFATPGPGTAPNIAFVSRWDNDPRDRTVALQGTARHLYLLLAGSTNSMQSRCDNGEIVVTYADGTVARLALVNPTNWWPIDEDYWIDAFAFRRPEAIPPRVDLRTGAVRVLDATPFEGHGGTVRGGAATVLDLPLDPDKPLRSLTVRALANEVVIGLMAATLVR